MSLGPGTVVSPSLRLVRKIGQGGMGSVWVAEHLTLRTLVAVKFVSPELALHPGAMERFSREATIAAQMKHPHAVQILDHGMSHQGAPFIAMELLDGQDLSHRIRQAGHLSPQETQHILAQTCKALTRAHSLGLVHRDIKPDNIFLTDLDGEPFVKVLDFGIARQTTTTGQSATATGALLGTPYYMSPEQAMSARRVDARADLWSVAVVAYQCVTGRVPFDGDTLPAVFVAIANGSFVPPSRLVEGLPASLDAWFARSLAREPDRRFSTARELAEAFAAAIGNPTQQSRPEVMSLPVEPKLAATGNPEPGTLMDATVSLSRGRSGRRAAIAAGTIGLLAAGAIGVLAAARSIGRNTPDAPPVAAVSSEPRAELPASASAPSSSAVPSPSAVDVSQLPMVDTTPRVDAGSGRQHSGTQPKDKPKPTPSAVPPIPKSTRPELGL